MATTAAFESSTALTPPQTARERERAKTRQQRAEDIIYTLNHSITCLGVTDTVGLSSAANAYNSIFKPKQKVNLDHDHDHGYGAFNWLWDKVTRKSENAEYAKTIAHKEHHRMEHGFEHIREDLAKGKKKWQVHPNPAPSLTPTDGIGKAGKKFAYTSTQWLVAEAIGDIGAVPVTIALQRHAPGFMEWLRGPTEWATGWMFRSSTQKSAEGWGAKHGYAANSQEVKDRQQELYQYEMSHMPQMAVWTPVSIAMNYGAMLGLNRLKPDMFEHTSLKKFAGVKGLGALFTAGVILLVRGAIPGGAHKWDQTVGKKVVIPATKGIGSLFGVKGEDVDAFQQKRTEMGDDGSHGHFPAISLGGSKPKDAKAATAVAEPVTAKVDVADVAESVPANRAPLTKVQGGRDADVALSVERLQPVPATTAQAV